MASGGATGRGGGAWAAIPLAGGFLALAAWMWLWPRGLDIEIADPSVVDPALLEVGPRRASMEDPPTIDMGGFRQSCNGCHQIFTIGPVPRAAEDRSFHREIVLSHGMNNRCTNCHDAANLNRLRLHDGTSIAYAQTPMLCAQCHGTVYRDWERGAHGKTLGSWSPSLGPMVRLSCNQCHDPHAPAYPDFEPLPGPQTLRMGEPAPPVHDDRHRPLRRLLSPHSRPPAEEPHP